MNIKRWSFSTGKLYKYKLNTANYEQLQQWFRKRKTDKRQFRRNSSKEGNQWQGQTSRSGKEHVWAALKVMLLCCGTVCVWPHSNVTPQKSFVGPQHLPAWTSYEHHSVSDPRQPTMWKLKIKDKCKLFSSVISSTGIQHSPKQRGDNLRCCCQSVYLLAVRWQMLASLYLLLFDCRKCCFPEFLLLTTRWTKTCIN